MKTNLNKLTRNIFLNIAGLYIKLVFYPTDKPYINELLIANIKHYYGHFIILNDHSVDIKIDVLDRNVIEIIKKNISRHVRNYFNIFNIENNKRITTNNRIGFFQLQYIIIKALEMILMKKKGFLLHASAVLHGEKVILFTGVSGAGKSTASALLGRKYPVLADDICILKKEQRNFYFYQSPFVEKNRKIIKEDIEYPIKKVFFLRKDKNFKIEPIKNKEYIFKRLSRQLWAEQNNAQAHLKYFMEFVYTHDFYFLYFAKKRRELEKLFSTI